MTANFILTTATVALSMFAAAWLLTLVPRAGAVGRYIAQRLAVPPWLDGVIACLTWVPWLVAGVWMGWLGVLAALLGQFIGVQGWIVTHELWHREHACGPRIVKALNRIVGRWRNHLALWVTLIALPTLWAIRLTQLFGYPALIVLLGFPRYRYHEWISISRHKIDGLVGHDLLWCLYCDWMTGVYSLGAEMLRNVESFWCPIRFRDASKCANCRMDFPDIDGGWAPADASMQQVAQLVHDKYEQGERSWFGHPARLTIEGESVEQSDEPSTASPRRDEV